MSKRLVGKNNRVEYLSLNKSPLFKDLPNIDFYFIQKKSYENFFKNLPNLLKSYFPVESNDYNNNIIVNIKSSRYEEPDISENEARRRGLTWSRSIYFTWSVDWKCKRMQINIQEGDLLKENGIEDNIEKWIESSFKIGKFSLKRIDSNSSDNWKIKEIKGSLEITLKILEIHSNKLIIDFYCQKIEEMNFCSLPKINNYGRFIINGHDKIVVFQSVRAPSFYNFVNEKNIYGEIIPQKGPWISINYNSLLDKIIKLKFLNSGTVINFLDVLKTFSIEKKTIEELFSDEDLNFKYYDEAESLEIGINMPNFIFSGFNSYFNIGNLGRKRILKKIGILSQVSNKILAQDIYDKKGEILLKKGIIFDEKNLEILENLIKKEKISGIKINNSNNDLYLIKLFSPKDDNKILSVVGVDDYISEDKIYFDLSDLICCVSYYINLHNGLGKTETEKDRDELENQVIRCTGDLIYNLFDNKFGDFSVRTKKYLSIISRLQKADLSKIPTQGTDASILSFFNTSPLVRLEDGTNVLSGTSSSATVSRFGLGGFGISSFNANQEVRDLRPSQAGMFFRTSDGPKVGLVHEKTINSGINKYGQMTSFYYLVKEGIITPKIIELTSEESKELYITHSSIRINENNEIVDNYIEVVHNSEYLNVPKNKVNCIYSSHFFLNSAPDSLIPFISNNDSTRVLMSANMQRQAIPILFNEPPIIATGIEENLSSFSSLTIKAEEKGKVEKIDSSKIIISGKVYKLRQISVTNKNTLVFSRVLVKKGEKVEKGQIIACGNETINNELSLGRNLNVAYMSFWGFGYEDAFIVSEKVSHLFTYFSVKVHKVILRKTKNGPEISTNYIPEIDKERLSNLDENGIIKIGKRVKGGDIIVGKLTPNISQSETEEEALFRSIIGEKPQKFSNSSFSLPANEEGIVYKVIRNKEEKKRIEEIIEIYVINQRNLEAGDKLTTRFGNKGVVSKILKKEDMPYDKNGEIIDIIVNPLSIPTRMNIGQLLESVTALAAYKLKENLIIRPFNSPSLDKIKELITRAKIKNFGLRKLFDGKTGIAFDNEVYVGLNYLIMLNHSPLDKVSSNNVSKRSKVFYQPTPGRTMEGGSALRFGEMEFWSAQAHGIVRNIFELMGPKSDDIYGKRALQNSLIFDKKQMELDSVRSESFNIFLQFLRGIGLNLEAKDDNEKIIDFYKYFSRN